MSKISKLSNNCPFECPECSHGFNWCQNLNRHWQSVHKSPLARLQEAEAINQVGKGPSCDTAKASGQSAPKCPFSTCTFQSSQVKTLIEHMKYSHGQDVGRSLNGWAFAYYIVALLDYLHDCIIIRVCNQGLVVIE